MKTNLPIFPAHARYSPSSLSRAINCPVSIFISEPLPQRPASAEAEEGTIAHRPAEIAVQHVLENVQIGYTKKELQEYDEEMRFHAAEYAHYVRKAVKPYLHYEHFWDTEMRLVFDERPDPNGAPLGFGTADFIFIYKIPKTETSEAERHAIIVDYKYGRGVEVDTYENWQLYAYAYGAYKLLKGKVDTVTVHVFQPRIDGHDPVHITYTKEHLETYVIPTITSLISLVEYWFTLGEIPPADLTRYQRLGDPGSSHDWCRFCPAKNSVCALQNKDKSEKLIAAFNTAREKLPNGQKKTLTNIQLLTELRDNGVLNAQTIAFLTTNGTELKNLIDGVRAAALSILTKGGHIEGLKVVEGNASRRFIDDKDILFDELISLGIPNPVTTVEKFIGITEAEKILGKGNIPEHLLAVSDSPVYKIVSENEEGEEIKFGKDKALTLFKDKRALTK